MAFLKPLPEWKQPGIRPPESKIKEGYQVLDKPPAAWLNWQMNTTYEALQELQEKAAEKEDVSEALGEAKAYTDEKVADIDLTKISPESIGAAKKADLDAHAADAVKHITAAERTAWNGKADVKHTHDASDIVSGTINTGRLPGATTKQFGVCKLYDGIDGGVGAGNYLAASPLAVKQVYDEMMLVKQSVVDGKGQVAAAINGKGGGPVSSASTFPELAAGVNRISMGGYYPIWVDEKITAEYQIRNIDLVTITNPKIVIFSPLENVSNPCSFEIKNHYGVNWGDSRAYASLQMVDDAERIIYLHDMETNSPKSYSSLRLLENATFRRDLPHTVSIEKGWYNTDPLEERRYMIPRDFNFNGPIKIRLALKSAQFVGNSSYPEYIQAVLRGNIVWA
ncbi:tail fiber protein [Paenibacillus dendritiformis]|uniref:Tail fiber protein n=1 Tax=Paenibacillus dendritiformis C454 TaxID=1131935 RepID=H3SHJ5_9BACL|nr:tail fiber protein [Paenibacillus dendritiformis]EHQ61455.1 hypothetical protein PDENDC454_15042 [Paenibacillus dendritiformis C454]CAH8772980.1 phage tail protein [Paenibacillus dendritiformis]